MVLRPGEPLAATPSLERLRSEGVIHVEGGPMLNAALCDADVVDALNLTIAPHLVGSRGDALTSAPHAPRHFELVTTQLVEGFVFLRYERRKK